MPISYFCEVPGGRPREFEYTITRSFPHTRSLPLKQSVVAVDAYIRQPSAAKLRDIVNAILNWKDTNPVEFNARLSMVWPSFHGQMKLESMKYDEEFIECLDDTDIPLALINALAWVEEVNNPQGLGQFSAYACLDATTFARCINGDQSQNGDIRKRERDWRAGNFRPYGTNPAMAIIPNNRKWNAGKLRINYNNITNMDADVGGGKGAVCTTFGLLAAHVLTNNRIGRGSPRVEIVSYPQNRGSHVYVLVGRQGGLINNCIPNNWDAIVVDAWAAALGHPCVFRNRESFVFRGMTENLQLVMQRPAS